MLSIEPADLPEGALLARYRGKGNYTDCWTTEVSGAVSHEQFVAAFYTTAIFKLERFILKWLVAKPSTDTEAALLAAGRAAEFAAWSVEGRARDQLLLSDFQHRTRSWLMVVSGKSGAAAVTRLYFGSAVTARRNPRTGEASLGSTYRVLLGFHKLYSIVLLHAAKRSLQKSQVKA